MIHNTEGTAESGGAERIRNADAANANGNGAGQVNTGDAGEGGDANEVDPDIIRKVIYYWNLRYKLRDIARETNLPIQAISPILKPIERKAVKGGFEDEHESLV